MILRLDLNKIAAARLKDAEILYKGKRYDGAVYLCGYAIEIALKNRICRTLKWIGFPSTNREFEGLQSFKTHRLELLLSLSGQETKIRSKYLAEWSVVAKWEPEIRYSLIGTVTQTDALNIIESAKVIIKALR